MRTFVTFFLSAMLAMPADLPVRQVVLYKHGVGFFERSGRLGPGESARLDFDASEMNDVLKSLTIEERGGGKISGLRYDSMDPLSHKLSEFPFQIGGAQPLSGMFDQLKGARLELKFGNETIAGVIVNGRLIAGGDKQPELEGWDIVDNTTGEDWTKVQLSLVSGRPTSFVSQLYAPKYVERPAAELADDRAARPVVHSGAFDEVDAKNLRGSLAGARPAPRPQMTVA